MTECATDRRRARIRRADRNGVDGVEVSDDGLVLTVTFLGKAPPDLGPEHIRVEGGRRITGITAVDLRLEINQEPGLDDRAFVTIDRAGDNATYWLSVVDADGDDYRGFDHRYNRSPFRFCPQRPAEIDCRPTGGEPPVVRPAPVIDYTARDYATLRRMLLDRLTLVTPDWQERHIPDLGVTLVELLAYVGDRLTYRQDAVATEAYLDTARLRTSVRRHTRLVDYAMHDGCNARTFVVLETDTRTTLDDGDFRFVALDLTSFDPLHRPDLGTTITEEELAALPPGLTFEVFEPLAPGEVTVRPAHNAIRFWTWGDEECCLPKGATGATLRDDDRALRLRPGDLLVVEEVRGPVTGAAADADPGRRQAVRLTSVTRQEDDLYDQPVLAVTWDPDDALTFEACLSSVGGPDCALIEDVSLARGNVVLVDHGRGRTVCGGRPETFTAPPAPVSPVDCGTPDFGCRGGKEQDPAVQRIHELVTGAGERVPITPDDVRELTALLGQEAVARAGIGLTLDLDRPEGGREVVLPDQADEQAVALRALLAQVSYPALRRRFRPRLAHAPVTQRAAFPVPAHVASAQARVLAGIPDRVLARLTELLRLVRGHHDLDEDQLAELAVLFGRHVLDELDIDRRPLHAVRMLLSRRGELLAAKTRRLRVLVARAGRGSVLDHTVVAELTETWGERYTAGLAPAHPALAGSARAALRQDVRAALPVLTVSAVDAGDAGDTGQAPWTPRRDLVSSGPRDRHVVGEVEDDSRGVPRMYLRFGDGRHGAAPPAGADIAVSYRVGNGIAGNVGAEAVNRVVLCRDAAHCGVTRVRNPLAAVGGTDPETVEEVRSLAPLAPRRTLLRAVTAADYAALAGQVPGVQRAAAEIRWTGSSREVHVAIDPAGAGAPSTGLLDTVANAVEPARRIGHRLVVGQAVLVPLDVELSVCVAEGYQRGHVLRLLRAVLGNGRLPDGRLGFFHPDALSFGEPVRLSRLVAAAAAIPGVLSARVTRLRRLFGQDDGELAAGLLRLGPLEIAQLDNDPDRPENGRLTIEFGGAR